MRVVDRENFIYHKDIRILEHGGCRRWQREGTLTKGVQGFWLKIYRYGVCIKQVCDYEDHKIFHPIDMRTKDYLAYVETAEVESGDG